MKTIIETKNELTNTVFIELWVSGNPSRDSMGKPDSVLFLTSLEKFLERLNPPKLTMTEFINRNIHEANANKVNGSLISDPNPEIIKRRIITMGIININFKPIFELYVVIKDKSYTSSFKINKEYLIDQF